MTHSAAVKGDLFIVLVCVICMLVIGVIALIVMLPGL